MFFFQDEMCEILAQYSDSTRTLPNKNGTTKYFQTIHTKTYQNQEGCCLFYLFAVKYLKKKLSMVTTQKYLRRVCINCSFWC